DDEDGDPQHEHRPEDPTDEVQLEPGAARAEEVVDEEAAGVVAPGEVDGEPDVPDRPDDDDGVVGGDDEGDRHLEPAERLEPPAQPAEDGGGGPAEAVPQRVVEQEDRDPGGEQGDDVGQEKGSPTVLV